MSNVKDDLIAHVEKINWVSFAELKNRWPHYFAEHDEGDFGVKVLQPCLDILVGPADRHAALIAELRPFTIPTILEHPFVNALVGGFHFFRRVLATVGQAEPERTGNRDRVTEQGKDAFLTREL